MSYPRAQLGDAADAVAAADLDAGAIAASGVPATVDSAGRQVTLTELFGVSVAAGVTVWGITKLLSHLFSERT